MKHPSHKFQTMAPSELMMYLDGKHYPVVRQLMAQLDIHMSEVLRMNIGARASIIRLDLEYRSLAVLVRGRLQRNEEVLFPFIYQTLDEGLSSFERFDKLEKEVEDLHSSHLQMRLHLADLSEFRHGFKPEPESR
jgi:iron-sulfur cluster repair protein YtfE (RIC family)